MLRQIANFETKYQNKDFYFIVYTLIVCLDFGNIVVRIAKLAILQISLKVTFSKSFYKNEIPTALLKTYKQKKCIYFFHCFLKSSTTTISVVLLSDTTLSTTINSI